MTCEEVRNLLMRMLLEDGRFAAVGPHPDLARRPGGILVRMEEPAGEEFLIEATGYMQDPNEWSVGLPE